MSGLLSDSRVIATPIDCAAMGLRVIRAVHGLPRGYPGSAVRLLLEPAGRGERVEDLSGYGIDRPAGINADEDAPLVVRLGQRRRLRFVHPDAVPNDLGVVVAAFLHGRPADDPADEAVGICGEKDALVEPSELAAQNP